MPEFPERACVKPSFIALSVSTSEEARSDWNLMPKTFLPTYCGSLEYKTIPVLSSNPTSLCSFGDSSFSKKPPMASDLMPATTMPLN